jgi:DNA mismatch repair ATPase MutL
MSILSTLLVAAVCSAPQLRAQQSNPSTAQQPPETSQQPQQPANTQTNQTQTNQAHPATQSPAQNTPPAGQSQPQQGNPGTSVNPSQAPLQPVTTYPDATGAQQEEQSPNTAPAQTTIPEAPQPKKPAEPVGAATAESVPTAGGAAAKPAGVAIAPAKQHQTRSLLIKIGAVVAAGAALGTVYALSHGTSSTPPGTGIAGVTGR